MIIFVVVKVLYRPLKLKVDASKVNGHITRVIIHVHIYKLAARIHTTEEILPKKSAEILTKFVRKFKRYSV